MVKSGSFFEGHKSYDIKKNEVISYLNRLTREIYLILKHW